MKLKFIAAAIAALGTTAAFATPLNPTSETPALTFYIAGASAQKAGIQFIAAQKFFANPAEVVYITSSLTKNTTNFSDPLNFPQGSIGFFGMSDPTYTGGTSVKLMVNFSSANGSAAGLNQVIAADGSAAEANVVTVGTSACVTQAATSSTLTGISLASFKCSTYAPKIADVALTDVNYDEFPAGVVVGDATALTEVRATALEGFGVAVNNNLYRALQEQNVADGLLPSTCTPGVSGDLTQSNLYSAACQPSISKAQYLNVATAAYNQPSKLVPSVTSAASGTLKLYRRVPLSGTQAASGIYFLNKSCGDLTNTSFTPTGAGSYNAGKLIVVEGSQTDDVIDGIKTTTAGVYTLGVISLEKKDGDLGSGRFVKINGSSPTYPDGVNLDSTRRKAILNGTYDFAVEMAAYYGVTPSTDLVTRLLDSIKDPTLTDVPGIAYMTGSVAGKTAKLSRNNANCNLLK